MPAPPFTPDDVQTAHDEVLRIVADTDWPALDLRAMSDYPHGWCSAMSYTIGRLLLRRRLGTWQIAASGNHDWLEYVDDNNVVVYSVDATQHQFSEYSAARLGYGVAPRSTLQPAVEYATCGQEPSSWAKWAEQVVSAEVMRQLG